MHNGSLPYITPLSEKSLPDLGGSITVTTKLEVGVFFQDNVMVHYPHQL